MTALNGQKRRKLGDYILYTLRTRKGQRDG